MKMKYTADTGYLHDEPYQILASSDVIPPICLRFLSEYSWCAKAINNSKNPLAAALTLLNKHGEEGGELDKFIIRKTTKPPAQVSLSDKVQELLHKRRKLLRTNEENDFSPEAFHSGDNDEE